MFIQACYKISTKKINWRKEKKRSLGVGLVSSVTSWLVLLWQSSWDWGAWGLHEVTLPSWAQQGQKERGLRRGVPALGSTSKGANKEEEKGGKEEEIGSGEEEGKGWNKRQAEDKKHKRVRKKGNNKKKRNENTRNGEAETRETIYRWVKSLIGTDNGQKQTEALGKIYWATYLLGDRLLLSFSYSLHTFSCIVLALISCHIDEIPESQSKDRWLITFSNVSFLSEVTKSPTCICMVPALNSNPTLKIYHGHKFITTDSAGGKNVPFLMEQRSLRYRAVKGKFG